MPHSSGVSSSTTLAWGAVRSHAHRSSGPPLARPVSTEPPRRARARPRVQEAPRRIRRCPRLAPRLPSRRGLGQLGLPGRDRGRASRRRSAASSTRPTATTSSRPWAASTASEAPAGTATSAGSTCDGSHRGNGRDAGRGRLLARRRERTVFNLGDARFYGSDAGTVFGVGHQVIAMATTSDGKGYWLVNQAEAITSFGDAPWIGGGRSLPQTDLATPIVAAAISSDGGAWLTDAAGHVYTEGDAVWYGSLAGHHLAPGHRHRSGAVGARVLDHGRGRRTSGTSVPPWAGLPDRRD